LFFANQSQQVGLKPGTIFGSVAQQDLDQSAFACAEMSLDTSACKAVQERDWLLSQELFEFFGSHRFSVGREAMDAPGIVSIRF